MKLLTKFMITISMVTLCILAAGVMFLNKLPSSFYQTLIFLVLTTVGLFYYLVKTKRKRPDYFVQFYLLTMVVKLIAYLAFLVIVVTGNREGSVGNVVFFMGVYFLFTALEIAFLYRKVNS